MKKKLYIILLAIMAITTTPLIAGISDGVPNAPAPRNGGATHGESFYNAVRDGLNDIGNKRSTFMDVAWEISLAFAALIGLVGSYIVFKKWQEGDPNIVRYIIGWYTSMGVFIVMGIFLYKFVINNTIG